jgi:dihydroorotate dehydrogenase (NAD+) catalytic subunit
MSDPDLSVNIAGIAWKNPVATASGTFSVRDSKEFYDIGKLGAIVTKGISEDAWIGNDSPRIAEVYGGMLNSIGLQNPGVETFITEDLPLLKSYDCPLIVNVAGKSVDEYCRVVERLSETDVDMLEINISCPNIKEGGIGFGTDASMAFSVTDAIRKITRKPLIIKLTPNVTDITEIARAAETAGADALSLINTLLGMRIDVRKRSTVLASGMGGLSGPAIKPVAVRMVYQVRRCVQLPLIGMGGIMTGEDAMEFLMAGADGVAVGTAALLDPGAPVRIINELEKLMKKCGHASIGGLKKSFSEQEMI